MRKMIVGLGLVALLSFSIWAQQPAGQSGNQQNQVTQPKDEGHVLGAELAAIAEKMPKDRNMTQAFFRRAPYSVNMEHRVSVPQAASVHDKEAELFYVISGGGTIVTGGKLVEQTQTNADNLSGKSIEGGTSQKLTKGDFVLVPEGVPHWFSAVEGDLTLMSLHLPKANSAN